MPLFSLVDIFDLAEASRLRGVLNVVPIFVEGPNGATHGPGFIGFSRTRKKLSFNMSIVLCVVDEADCQAVEHTKYFPMPQSN